MGDSPTSGFLDFEVFSTLSSFCSLSRVTFAGSLGNENCC